MSFIKERIRAFGYAFSGIAQAFKTESPFKIHLAATIAVVLLGFYLKVTVYEWCILIFCCALVIITELVNTAIERLCDVVQPEEDKRIKFVKDVSAAAVLIATLASVIIGIAVFYGYFAKMF